MKDHPLMRLERAINLQGLICLFWGLFWVLNGLDKFINGTMVAPIEGYNRNGVITQVGSDEVLFSMYKTHPTGWFGVTRDPIFIAFFERLGLPSWAALTVLYTFGVIEVFLGLLFIFLVSYKIIFSSKKAEKIEENPLMSTFSLHRLALKLSFLFFIMFIVGDIFFGDRMEVWEHSTFMILILMSLNMLPKEEEFEYVIEEK